MKKKLFLIIPAISVVIVLLVTAILQILPEDKLPDSSTETESSAETDTDTAMSDETACTHILSEEWFSAEEEHFRICNVEDCDYVQDKEKCGGGAADCLHRAICTVCGEEYGETASHQWADAWTSMDSEKHARFCTTPGCAVFSDEQPHDFLSETDTSSGKICSLCGYRIEPEVHVHLLTVVSEVSPTCTLAGNSVYYSCDGCGKMFADAEALQEIDSLAETVIPAVGHSSDGIWQSNYTVHWTTCVLCGAELDKNEHTAGTDIHLNEEQHWYTCTCGKEMHFGAHFDANMSGRCDVCGYAIPLPETTAEEMESMAISQEGAVLEEILTPAQITILRPEASGTLTKSASDAVIDYSNHKDGYVMVQYTQNISERLKVKVEGPTMTYTYNITPKEWAVLPLADGNGDYKISVYKNVIENRYAVILATSFNVQLNNEFAPFLRPNQYVNYENAVNSTAKAAELVGGISDTLKKVEAIYSYVVHNITYDYQKAATVQSGYLPDLDKVLEERKGICFDYAALMTGMLRSQSIACKLVVGYADGAYHAWISVWTPEQGWVDNAIFFDGTKWQTMDPTFVSTGGSNAMEGVTYTSKYIY